MSRYLDLLLAEHLFRWKEVGTPDTRKEAKAARRGGQKINFIYGKAPNQDHFEMLPRWASSADAGLFPAVIELLDKRLGQPCLIEFQYYDRLWSVMIERGHGWSAKSLEQALAIAILKYLGVEFSARPFMELD